MGCLKNKCHFDLGNCLSSSSGVCCAACRLSWSELEMFFMDSLQNFSKQGDWRIEKREPSFSGIVLSSTAHRSSARIGFAKSDKELKIKKSSVRGYCMRSAFKFDGHQDRAIETCCIFTCVTWSVCKKGWSCGHAVVKK